MKEIEQALQNTIESQGWAEGAASAESLGSFLNRRMAAIAVAATEADFSDEELDLLAA